ncbi:MAG: hypothetical protein PQJ47_11450 [Sphaerochaetaceae bacterium]|nr:hypothetical protein [Sphaerochaetaceae bacterium]
MRACYLVTLTDRKRFFITPFVNPVSYNSWDEHEQVVFYSAESASKPVTDEALLTLYRQIDRGVDRWIQDVRYLPRLLIGGLIFLISYFFFSLAVRDPIPMVDELVIASVITILSLSFISRRDKKSSLSVKRRFELKQNASNLTFETDDSLAVVEEYLYRYSQMEMIDLIDAMLNLEGSSLDRLDLDFEDEHVKEFALLFIENLEYNFKNEYQLSKKYQKMKHDEKQLESFSGQLLKSGMNGDVDLSLLALTIAVENQLPLH